MRRMLPIAFFAVLVFIAAPHCSAQDHAESRRKLVARAEPSYPGLARTMHISGTVRIEAVVAPNGSVKSTSVLGGHPVLVQSAMDAVHKCKWETGPHETKEVVILNFRPD
jgi:TonB family protein